MKNRPVAWLEMLSLFLLGNGIDDGLGDRWEDPRGLFS